MSRRAIHRESKPHAVWIKIPLMDAEVDSRHASKEAAKRAAVQLRKKYPVNYSEFGKTEIWVESPGSIEELLRQEFERDE